MIRLTLNTQSDSEIHLFNKSTISIGADANLVDLVLQDPSILPVHLTITEQEGNTLLINSANDPFVTLNGIPFGKKELASGDLILIHSTTLLFEILNESSSSSGELKEKNISTPPLSVKEESESKENLPSPTSSTNNIAAPFHFSFEKEVDVLDEEDMQKTPLEDYLKEIDSLQQEPFFSLSSPERKGIERKKSLKDDYLRDLDDDNQNHGNTPFANSKEPNHLYLAWKWILLFIFSIVAISAIIGSALYLTVSDKTEAQETKAAQGVADIAMALMHAQLNLLKPHNHNWSDVDFLKSNLLTILPDTPSNASQIDTQGQFNCCPYSLRIYTSSDLSHFLLIAQPAPSLLNWLIPQSLIVVDSHLMELRMLKDVRGLNRLLANPDPLEGLNGKEITSLVKQEGLIRLSSLATDTNSQDFPPPKNLAWIRPGAENLIYNAPRYYRLGHNIIQKSIALSTSKGSSNEVAALKQTIDTFSNLQHFVLYSDQGKKSAAIVRQGLMLFAPSDKLLFGYLLFNAQGKIHQVHLLKDEDESKESSLAMKEKEPELFALSTPTPANTTATSEIFKENKTEQKQIDINHPIYIQLQALVVARENEIKSLANALSSFIEQDVEYPRAQFQTEFQDLSHTYLMTNAKHKEKIKETLENLYHQYEDVSIDQFLIFIKELKLDNLIDQENQTFALINENCQQNMELLLTYIENSKSLPELDNLMHMANSWMNFEYIKDSHELLKYQNLIRNKLLEQLEKFLLSQKKHSLIKEEDRGVLQNILNQERFITSEEREFFLSEFENRIAIPQGSQEKVNSSINNEEYSF